MFHRSFGLCGTATVTNILALACSLKLNANLEVELIVVVFLLQALSVHLLLFQSFTYSKPPQGGSLAYR